MKGITDTTQFVRNHDWKRTKLLIQLEHRLIGSHL